MDQLTLAKLQALSNPVRFEIYSLLGLEGAADATEIARHLKMDELSVYYHLRKLESAALLVRAKGNRKTKATYVRGDRFSVEDLDLERAENRAALAHFVEGIARALAREYSEAIEAHRSKAHAKTYVSRTAIRLTREDQEELFAKLHELSRWVEARRNADGERVAITVAVAPVD